MNTLERILVIGSGSAGQRHFRLLKKLCPKSEIRIQGSREFIEKFFNYTSTGTTSDQGHFEPNLVIVASPATSHIEIARYFAQRGSHLLIEKPLSTNIKGLSELIELTQKKKCKVVVGYNLRYSESLTFFRNCIKSDKVGLIKSVQIETGQFLPEWRPAMEYSDGVSANMLLGGGVILELSHELDYLLWIFGRPEWVIASTQKLSNLKIDVEDSANIVMGIIDQETHQKLVANISLDFIRRDKTRKCVAIGESGTIMWDGISQTVSKYDISHSKWETLFQGTQTSDSTYELQLRNLIDSIQNDTYTRESLVHAATVMHVIEAVRESSSKGIRVDMVSEI